MTRLRLSQKSFGQQSCYFVVDIVFFPYTLDVTQQGRLDTDPAPLCCQRFFAHYSNLHSHKTHCTRINSQVSASHLCNFIFTAHYTGSVPDPVFLSGILSDQAGFCDLSGICLSEIGQTVILQSENNERRSEAIAHIRILR